MCYVFCPAVWRDMRMFQDEKPAAVLLKDCTGQGDLQVLSTLVF